MILNDKLADMYFNELESACIDFKADTSKIELNQKVLFALLDIVGDVQELDDLPDQIKAAYGNCVNAEAVRAYKMGIVMGQTIAGVKS